MAARKERVEFRGSDGQRLAALLDLPAGEPGAYALFAHCFTCSKDIFAAARIAGRLTEHGFGVLRFDFTGIGSSEGEFANTNFSSNLEDLVAAANFLRESRAAPKLLIGHSLGGAAVLAAAARVPEASAVATIAAPAEPLHLKHLLQDGIAEIESKGEATVAIGGKSFRIKRQFLEDIARHRLEEAVRNLHKALIIFHSPRDEVVGIEEAGRIFTAARHPKSFVSLDAANHLLSRREDAAYVADVLAAWAGRYVEMAAKPRLPSVEPRRPGEVVVADTGAGRLSEEIAVGPHRILADEPVASGGGDTGPGPYDFLLAALGACTAMTLRLYAERKGLALARTIVRLEHSKVHAADAVACESKLVMLDHIERRITLEGALDAAARQRLLEIADKCPVHRTLTSRIEIATTLEAAAP